MEAELGGLPDHLGGLAGVLDPRQLDDDAPLAGARQRRLGDAEGVDAAADHLERAVGGLAVGLHPLAVLGLQDDLGAALEVEAEARCAGEGEDAGHAEHGQGGGQADQAGAAGTPRVGGC